MVKRGFVVWAATLVLAGWIGGASAQDDPPAGSEPVHPLGLGEALGTALQNNLDLVFARKDPQIAMQNVVIADATFDPALQSRVVHSESELEPTTADDPDSSSVSSASVGVVQPFRFGGQASVDLNLQQSEVQGGVFFLAPESIESDLSLNLSLPLLRGFGREVTTIQWILSRADLDLTAEDFRSQAQATLQTVEQTYWELVAARRALEVAIDSLERAKDLLDLNRKKVEVGTLAPIEITQAEAGVAAQEEGVIIAETALLNVEDEMRRLLALPPDHPMWQGRVVPTDEPVLVDQTIDLDAAIATAMSHRPEIVRSRLLLRQQELNERFRRNQVRHDLSLDATYSPTGNDINEFVSDGPDGIPGTPDDTFQDPSYGDALSELAKNDFYNWTIGLTYRVPFGNRAAKAELARAELEREKAEVGLQNAVANVRVDVRRAAREVESGLKRVAAARASVFLQREKLEAEQKKFENGMSTSFEVLTFQNDLANAELREIRALSQYSQALVGLQLAQGTLIESRGLELDLGAPEARGPFRRIPGDPFVLTPFDPSSLEDVDR